MIPPAVLIARRPSVPSDAVPDRTTPAACLPQSAARALRKESIGRLRPLRGRGGVSRTPPEMPKLHRGGITYTWLALARVWPFTSETGILLDLESNSVKWLS